MKGLKLLLPVISVEIILFIGCSAPAVDKQVNVNNVIEVQEATADNVNSTDSNYTYAIEDNLLEQMLECYDQAVAARIEGDYGLAESKLEEAFILTDNVKIEEIQDSELQKRFSDALASLAIEYGRVLKESTVISAEDPNAWLEEVDADQFKSGQWTDEELKKIVLKIATKCDIPIEFNEKVRNSIYFFQNGGRDRFSRYLSRGGKYLPIMKKIFADEGIPQDLAYLSLIESGFSPTAVSPARAVGLWQFIYSTGKLYGLNRDQWVDERRDPLKSTKAAAKHLNDLYRMTDDWNNVMASYNCGPTRISRQLKKTENLEFWNMDLPRETKNYVPTFMAAVIISKAPEIFGFSGVVEESPLEYDTVEVKPYTSLKTASLCAGVDVDALMGLNPELLQQRVPPGKENYVLKIPKSTKDRFLVEYQKIPEEKYEPPRILSVRVRRGDTLSKIANNNNVSVESLKSANRHIRNINQLKVGQKINIPGKVDSSTSQIDTASLADNEIESETRSKSTSNSRAVKSSSKSTKKYKVQRNDTLASIANRYDTTIQNLQKLNNLGKRTTIFVGQRLSVPSASASEDVNSGSTRITYIVQENDTLYEISRKYGVDLVKIKELNNIEDHKKIRPGQKLVIEK